jgi:hypothetical protein
MNKFLIALNVISSIACIGLATKFIALPFIGSQLYKENYKTLVFQCDNVMQNHLIAKNKVNVDKSDESIKQLHAAEIGLLSCNDYDAMRKKLISWGLTENDLAQIGLEAIEEKANDVRTFVKTHEIKY